MSTAMCKSIELFPNGLGSIEQARFSLNFSTHCCKRRRNESQRHDAKRKRMVDKWRRIPLGEGRRRKECMLKSKPSPDTLKPCSRRETLSSPSDKDSPYRPRERTHHTVLVRELISMPHSIPELSRFYKGFCKQKYNRQE
jgi:hypothetical protein